MMRQGITTVQGSGDDGLALVKLLADQDELNRRIEAFEAAKSAADQAVALVGPANRITELLADAEKRHADAVRLKAEAEEIKRKAEAAAAELTANTEAATQKMIDEATVKAGAIFDEAEKIKDMAVAAREAFDASAAARDAEADERESRLTDMERAAKTAIAAAEDAKAKAAEAEARFKDKLSAITAIAKD